jgi:hypothetical protein
MKRKHGAKLMRFLPYRKDLLLFCENTNEVGVKDTQSDNILSIKGLKADNQKDFLNLVLRLEDGVRQGRSLFIVFYNNDRAELNELVFNEMINERNPFFSNVYLDEIMNGFVSFQYTIQTTEL